MPHRPELGVALWGTHPMPQLKQAKKGRLSSGGAAFFPEVRDVSHTNLIRRG
jgi:hypothetical protein